VKRGDVVTVAPAGDYGKPRPAVVIQSDALMETDSVLVCLITSLRVEARVFRLPVPESPQTGLRRPSCVMADKIIATRRDKFGKVIGRLDEATMLALGAMLAFVVGVAD
jgi:mRNA interferase MazF